MKKLTFYFIFLIPIIPHSTNLPSPGLPDESVKAPIDSMLFLLFTGGIGFDSYHFKKK